MNEPFRHCPDCGKPLPRRGNAPATRCRSCNAKFQNAIRKNNVDSTTNVDISHSQIKIRFEDKLTVRCDIETKQALKRFSEQTGITECQIIHGLLTAYLYGMQQKFKFVDKSPTINLTIERQVQRVRRYSRVESDVWNNFYDGTVGQWIHVDDDLNCNGHGVGCACSLCRGEKERKKP